MSRHTKSASVNATVSRTVNAWVEANAAVRERCGATGEVTVRAVWDGGVIRHSEIAERTTVGGDTETILRIVRAWLAANAEARGRHGAFGEVSIRFAWEGGWIKQADIVERTVVRDSGDVPNGDAGIVVDASVNGK